MSFFGIFSLIICIVSAQLDRIVLPPGFNISVLADVKGGLLTNPPREINVQIYQGSTIIYVASNSLYPANNVIALIDKNQDNIIDESFIVYSGMEGFPIFTIAVNPLNGQMFMTQPNQTYYCDGNVNDLVLNNWDKTKRLTCHNWFTAPWYDSHHGQHFLRFNRFVDNQLCIAYGQECNECIVKDQTPPKSTITCYDVTDPTKITNNLQGTRVATGVRNSYGFDWHPVTKQLWFTDNGRDNLYSTTNMPDDELNVVTTEGEFFGYPYCHSLGCGDPYQRDVGCVSAITDPDLGDGGFTNNCTTNFTLAKQPMSPHVAVLGMKFYTGNMFPAKYKNAIFVAEHGSWDRTPLIGYRIGVVIFNDNYEIISNEIFAQGWLNDVTQRVWGRVNCVDYLPDGSMIVTDDKFNAVYRITYDASQDTPSKHIEYNKKVKQLRDYWTSLNDVNN